MTTNQHGLSRDIPDPVKRLIRQACGFGCVICGSGIVEYEHFDPEFVDAKIHDPEGITLLCPQCHAKVTRGIWSKAKVRDANTTPASLKTGFSREFFDLGNGSPTLQVGGVRLSNCPVPIQVGGRPLFSIKEPEEAGAPFRFSGFFTDSSGKVSLTIKDNEWIAATSNWDVEVSGKSIVIREALGEIHLRLIADPPDGLIVDKLDMSLGGLGFRANGDSLQVLFPGGGASVFTGCVADNCQVGMSF